jgi:hypothetical protein
VSEVTVYDNQQREVPAKVLRDPAGRAIVDPTTGLPVIVDENFDLDRAIAFGRSLRDPPIDPYSQNRLIDKKAAVYGAMIHAFQEGGPLDVQRSYNNKVGGGKPEYVKAFRPAASYIYGLVARAAGLSPDEIIAGGGLYNLLKKWSNPDQDISGPWFNAPPNVPWIEEGMKAYDSGRFIRSAGQQVRMDQTPRGERSQTGDHGRATAATAPGTAVDELCRGRSAAARPGSGAPRLSADRISGRARPRGQFGPAAAGHRCRQPPARQWLRDHAAHDVSRAFARAAGRSRFDQAHGLDRFAP